MAMNLKMNKKGMVFTIIGVILASFLIIYQEYDYYHFKEKSFVVQQRVTSMDNFIYDIEKDIERAIFIGGYRSIISIEKYISEEGVFLEDLDDTFEEVFINGTINSTTADLMTDASFYEWEARINEEANKANVNVEFFPNDVYLVQDDPWSFTIHLNVSYSITDRSNMASWYITNEYEKKIPIIGFEDPIYLMGSNGLVTNMITQSPYTDFVDQTTNDTTNLTDHLINSYYVTSDSAPSFLMRFEGNFSNSSNGIESMINVEDFTRQGFVNKTQSLIDYIYLNPTQSNPDILCSVDYMPAWFIIDEDHQDKYEVEGLDSVGC